MREMKAIETSYRGFVFRSRLEARWAVFFDALEVEWEYEKEGFELGRAGRYLPDFYLPEQRVWIEIKGDTPTGRDADKISAFRVQSELALLVSVGQIGAHRWECGGANEIRKLGWLEPLVGRLTLLTSTIDAVVQCPFCWCPHVQMVPQVHDDGVLVHMVGGCRHQWTLNICNEWDATYSKFVGPFFVIRDFEESFAQYMDFDKMLSQSQEQYDAAIDTAKSARFEHGVSGALHRSQSRR